MLILPKNTWQTHINSLRKKESKLGQLEHIKLIFFETALKSKVERKVVPDKIDIYKISQEIGRGPSSQVFRAINTQNDRIVALKVLAPSVSDNVGVLTELNRRVVLCSNLEHQNIAKVFDIGEETGYHYIASELINGVSLRELVQHYKKFTVENACRIIQSVAGGLHYAHKQNVKHGNLIPDNIIIEKQTGRVVITDFGISEVLAGCSQRIANDPNRIGFRAPEALNLSEADNKSDIFSLGAVLYYMLTGDCPTDSPVEASADALPTIPKLRSLIPTLPIWLETLMARTMMPDPSKRNVSANDVAEEVEVGLESDNDKNGVAPMPMNPPPFDQQNFSDEPEDFSGTSTNMRLLRSKTAGGTLGMLMRKRNTSSSIEASVQDAEKRLLGLDFNEKGKNEKNSSAAQNRSAQRNSGPAEDREHGVDIAKKPPQKQPPLSIKKKNIPAPEPKAPSYPAGEENFEEADLQNSIQEPPMPANNEYSRPSQRTSPGPRNRNLAVGARQSRRSSMNPPPVQDNNFRPGPNEGFDEYGQPIYDDQMPPYDGMPPYDMQPPYGDQPPYDDMPPYDMQPPYDDPYGQPEGYPEAPPPPARSRRPSMNYDPDDPQPVPVPLTGGYPPQGNMDPGPMDMPQPGPDAQGGGIRPMGFPDGRGQSQRASYGGNSNQLNVENRRQSGLGDPVNTNQFFSGSDSGMDNSPSSPTSMSVRKSGMMGDSVITPADSPAGGPPSFPGGNSQAGNNRFTMDGPGTVRVEQQTQKSGGGSSGNTVMVILAVVMLIALCGGAYWYFFLPKGTVNIELNTPTAIAQIKDGDKLISKANITDGKAKLKAHLGKEFTLYIVADGYKDYQENMTIQPGSKEMNLPIELEGAPASLSVNITNQKLVSQPQVKILSGDKIIPKGQALAIGGSAKFEVPTNQNLTLIVNAPGFAKYKQNFTVAPSERNKDLDVSLKRDKGTVRVSLKGDELFTGKCSVALLQNGAKVDGSAMNNSNNFEKTFEIALGKEYVIKASSDIHASVQQSVKVSADKPDADVVLVMKPMPILNVFTGSYANVYVDGVSRGKADKNGSLKIASGLVIGKQHKVTCKRDGYKDNSAKFVAKAGDNRVDVALELIPEPVKPTYVYEDHTPKPSYNYYPSGGGASSGYGSGNAYDDGTSSYSGGGGSYSGGGRSSSGGSSGGSSSDWGSITGGQ